MNDDTNIGLCIGLGIVIGAIFMFCMMKIFDIPTNIDSPMQINTVKYDGKYYTYGSYGTYFKSTNNFNLTEGKLTLKVEQ